MVDGPLDYPHDRIPTARAANEEGWRNAKNGAPIDESDVNDAINTIAWSLRLLNLLGDGRRGFALGRERLTAAGRTTALAILRAQSLHG